MHTFLWALARIFIIGGILGFLMSRWFGINTPLMKKNPPSEEMLNARIHLPPGFSISVYAKDLPDVRMLRFTEAGDLLASLPNEGRIVLLERDADNDGAPDGRSDLVTGLNRPHGMDYYQGRLYVAETDAIGRIAFNPKTRKTQGEYEQVVTGIPGGSNHWTRTLRFGPDGLMYVSVGSSCNVCEEKNPKRAAMLRYNPDGGQDELFATGLRNTVGFDWHPDTHELFGVDNGRDFLGDDFPPEELNRIEQGKFYGWPYANGNKIPDPDLGAGHEEQIRNSLPPVHEFAAHTAPLGMTFLRNKNLPPEFKNSALVALHGSWNRTEKTGYKVVSLHFGPKGTITERDFISGFEFQGDVIARPVDVAEGPDGAIYVSDDFTGSIYRVSWP
ncbi:PQQ-dependent sugar dehydrogenase [Methylobacter marinus]|uniref:PQQ-dependent sugar dehydrogenase n=1 Tax=Methylobacter marinus TaxID=34058 RepID=UPI00035E7778|nr:sorbosone dehydrogenase family protein [Methylobacter marinus]